MKRWKWLKWLSGAVALAGMIAIQGQLHAGGTGGYKTEEPPQMKAQSGWRETALITVGEQDEEGNSVNVQNFGYEIPGILDGIGAFKLDGGTVRIYVNHEFRDNLGYPYTVNGNVTLVGARVSYIDFNANSKKPIAAGLGYHFLYEGTGNLLTASGNGLNRLCSSYGAAADETEFVDDIFLTGEETGGGQEYALDIANDSLYAVPVLGRAAWENVCPVETGTSGKVALMVGDDRGGAPLLLYVGEKGVERDRTGTVGGQTVQDFLVRNGLDNGCLYVWVADNGDLSPEDWNGTGTSRSGEFVKIPHYMPGMAGYDALGFADQATQDALSAAAGAFQFSRPEDVAPNPADNTQIVLASTGRASLFPSDSWGTTYVIDVDWPADIEDVAVADLDNIVANIDLIYDGDDADKQDFGIRSPDNLDWASDGLIYIQEDRSVGGFGDDSGIETSIWQLDPGTSEATRIGIMNRSAVPTGQTDTDPGDLGDWESSGILDVSDLFPGGPGLKLIFDVQAHSLRGGLIDSGNLVQGGQLLFFDQTAIGKAIQELDEAFGN
jgi:hypothetical protein